MCLLVSPPRRGARRCRCPSPSRSRRSPSGRRARPTRLSGQCAPPNGVQPGARHRGAIRDAPAAVVDGWHAAALTLSPAPPPAMPEQLGPRLRHAARPAGAVRGWGAGSETSWQWQSSPPPPLLPAEAPGSSSSLRLPPPSAWHWPPARSRRRWRCRCCSRWGQGAAKPGTAACSAPCLTAVGFRSACRPSVHGIQPAVPHVLDAPLLRRACCGRWLAARAPQAALRQQQAVTLRGHRHPSDSGWWRSGRWRRAAAAAAGRHAN